MKNLDFIESDDCGELCRRLRALPVGSQIVSIYARNSRHVAWYSTPEDVVETTSEESKAEQKKSLKPTKGK